MKKIIDPKHTIIYTAHYPSKNMISSKKVKQNRAVLGIGGNIGDVPRRFERLYWFIRRSKYIKLIENSPILKNPPFGLLEQDDFHNAIIVVSTILTPRELLYYLLRVEKRFGRKRSVPNGARTLDIDIIFYNDISISSKELTIPHQHWMSRESVLIPLSLMKSRH